MRVYKEFMCMHRYTCICIIYKCIHVHISVYVVGRWVSCVTLSMPEWERKLRSSFMGLSMREAPALKVYITSRTSTGGIHIHLQYDNTGVV